MKWFYAQQIHRRTSLRICPAVAASLCLLNAQTAGAQTTDAPLASPQSPKGSAAYASDELTPTYLDTLLKDHGTKQIGYLHYSPRSAMLNGIPYDHSLMTAAINNFQPITQFSAVTFALPGSFARLQATIGRDDEEQQFGPAYCYFEVWGDGQRLFRSRAMRSSVSPVFSDGGRPRESVPVDIDVPIQGVKSLRLVVRFATDITQEARYINRAFGCTWGDARLIPSRPSKGQPDTPLIIALRRAAIRLISGREVTSETLPPPHLYIAPVHVTSAASAPAAQDDSDSRAHDIIAQTIYSLHRGETPLALPVLEPDAAALAQALSSQKMDAPPAKELPELTRNARVDYVILAAIRIAGDDQIVALQLVEASRWKTVNRVEIPVSMRISGVP